MFTQPKSDTLPELPVLRLGLAGFSAAEQAAIQSMLRVDRSTMRWEIAPLEEADAWCVNGSRTSVLPDGTVKIVQCLPSGRSMRINLQQMDWPVAFSMPLASPELNRATTFEPDSQESVQAILKHFEGCLSPLIVQFYLASTIVEKDLDLKSCVFHVGARGRLYAVVSQRMGIGVWPIADPAALPHVAWVRRPPAADAIPRHFVHTDFSQLMWQYAMRTTRDWLPEHYRTSRLYLRRPPRLPLRVMNDHSLLLMRELGHAAGTVSELQRRTGIPQGQLARQLAGLYLVGAITANPDRAPAPRSARENAQPHSGFNRAGPASESGLELTVQLAVHQPRFAEGA